VWAAYGWLTNRIDPDENVNRVSMFAAIGAMLVVSLTIPDAFGDRGVLFGCSYFFVRAMHLVLYVRNTPGASEGGDLQAILKLAPGFLLGSALLIVAGLLDDGARASIWILAILVDWSTPLLFGTGEFHLDPGQPPLRRCAVSLDCRLKAAIGRKMLQPRHPWPPRAF
jgi:low temperature requirement protein LtrA